MKHAMKKFNSVQDASDRIPKDEPVFLLRGQDILAPATIRFWADAAERAGVSERRVALARDQANKMEEWKPRKLPGSSPDDE